MHMYEAFGYRLFEWRLVSAYVARSSLSDQKNLTQENDWFFFSIELKAFIVVVEEMRRQDWTYRQQNEKMYILHSKLTKTKSVNQDFFFK